MKGCTLFALPSWYEGLGCVYLEAMSAERPAIACLGQGIEEVIQHRENGWLIEPKNLSGLTAALRALLSNRFYARTSVVTPGKLSCKATLWHIRQSQLSSLYRESLP